jgi:hypothetical protein
MATAPQDRKDKIKTVDDLDDYFSFELGGNTYVLPLKTKDVLTPGWVRKHRRLEETDYIMTLLENLCGVDMPDVSLEDRKTGSDILNLLDKAGWPDHKRIQEELATHLQVTVGE